MIIVNKNLGTKIPYAVENTTICFDDDLSVNLAKRQRDEQVHIDICYDGMDELVIGAEAGRAYVAEIDIPARAYSIVQKTDGDEERQEFVPLPLDMDTVTLSLWAVE